jgi:hypothetical protein
MDAVVKLKITSPDKNRTRFFRALCCSRITMLIEVPGTETNPRLTHRLCPFCTWSAVLQFVSKMYFDFSATADLL